MQRKCKGYKKSGERCSSWALADSEFCIAHDPKRVIELAEYRKRGGAGRSNASRARKQIADLRNMPGVQTTLLQAIDDLKTGKLEPPVATAIATLARALVAVAGVTSAVTFEEQLAEMRRQMADLSEGRTA